MAKQKDEKTNVMRVLEQKKVAYTAHTYPHEEGVAVDGVTVARSMGHYLRERVFLRKPCERPRR